MSRLEELLDRLLLLKQRTTFPLTPFGVADLIREPCEPWMDGIANLQPNNYFNVGMPCFIVVSQNIHTLAMRTPLLFFKFDRMPLMGATIF